MSDAEALMVVDGFFNFITGIVIIALVISVFVIAYRLKKINNNAYLIAKKLDEMCR